LAVHFSKNKNSTLAKTFYLIAAKSDCESQYIMANYYKDENDIQNSILYFEKCFLNNITMFCSLPPKEKLYVSNSINNLMTFYEDNKDFVKLINMLKKASFYGHKSSTEFLGLFYYDLEKYYEAKYYFKICQNQLSGKLKEYYCNLFTDCLFKLNQLKRT
jgi:hypothetical protein